MFSGLSTFIPNAFQQNSTPKPPPQFTPDDDDDDDKIPIDVDEHGVVKKRDGKKDKSPTETFIFVRPPPSKTNHPLNLQVQLVPPNTRAPGGVVPPSNPAEPRTSTDTTTNESNNSSELSRVPSNRSELSYSGYSSTASFSSVASTASTASSRRMIIPLYSLQAHNVMTNVIVDAGTDAKIAKFNKRGIEFIDLAHIEPIEVWVPNALSNQRGNSLLISGNGSNINLPRMSNDVVGLGVDGLPQPTNTLLMPTNGNGRSSMMSSRPVTPEGTHTPSSSRLSLSSAGLDHHQIVAVGSRGGSHSPQQASGLAAEPLPAVPPPGKRNIFGKFFKKKESGVSSPSTPTNPPRPPVFGHAKTASIVSASNVETTPTPNQPTKRSSLLGMPSSPSPSKQDAFETPTNSAPSSTIVARQPVLGIQPVISCTIYPPPPGSRPSMYAWHVRRWMKGGDNGLLSGMIGKLNINDKTASGISLDRNGSSSFMGGVEVRFEWKRGKAKLKKRRGKTVNGSIPPSNDVSRRGSTIGGPGPGDQLQMPTTEEITKERKKANRLSTLSHHSMSTNGGGDDGNESDPEDSETPWTCTLKVRRAAERASSNKRTIKTRADEDIPEQPVLRIKVGTLSPTPHHPKVVAMLKVPFPLPDVKIDSLAAKKREVLPTGSVAKKPAIGGDESMILTAEEIKDIVCCTGLWLVVREGIGGVGKVARKGDGWRIRG